VQPWIGRLMTEEDAGFISIFVLVREKTRARLLQSSGFHHLCRIVYGSEELDARTHVLRLTAARKSVVSCYLRRYHGGSSK
jgi:hypothetical protein